MNSRVFCVLMFFCAGSALSAGATKNTDETLATFVGVWKLSLSADAATFGDRSGAGTGTLTCVWGPKNAWIDCDLDSVYDGMGSYQLKMILYRTQQPKIIGAFVTNTLGGGRLYTGAWTDSHTLLFEDAWIDPAKKWEYQRTTYTFGNLGDMRFDIEVSHDGIDYLPHSTGIYHRASATGGNRQE